MTPLSFSPAVSTRTMTSQVVLGSNKSSVFKYDEGLMQRSSSLSASGMQLNKDSTS